MYIMKTACAASGFKRGRPLGGAREARALNLCVKRNGLRGRARGAREEFVVKRNGLRGRARGARAEFVQVRSFDSKCRGRAQNNVVMF